MLQGIVHGQMNEIKVSMNVRFGSKADICGATGNVRYGPEADLKAHRRASSVEYRLNLEGALRQFRFSGLVRSRRFSTTVD
jgi:hypothetical protein